MTTEQTAETTGRPVLVWIISGFVTLAGAWVLFGFYRIGTVPIESIADPAARAYVEGLSSVDFLFSITVAVLNMAGAVTLFLMRRVALYLFCAALTVNVLDTVRVALTTTYFNETGFGTMIGGYAIAGAIIFYTWHLYRRGRLR